MNVCSLHPIHCKPNSAVMFMYQSIQCLCSLFKIHAKLPLVMTLASHVSWPQRQKFTPFDLKWYRYSEPFTDTLPGPNLVGTYWNLVDGFRINLSTSARSGCGVIRVLHTRLRFSTGIGVAFFFIIPIVDLRFRSENQLEKNYVNKNQKCISYQPLKF